MLIKNNMSILFLNNELMYSWLLVREKVENDLPFALYVSTKDQLAYVLTKSMSW